MPPGIRTTRLGTDDADIARAAAWLEAGELVAFPTETVYGLGARADDAAAVRRIFEAKGRPAHNPLIVHVLDSAAARRLAAHWPPEAERLAAAFWPGPLTLVVARAAGAIVDEAAASGPTLAMRAPAHPVARRLLAACRAPVAAPSANRSTAVSPTTADHVLETLDGRIRAVIDGGPTEVGIESTIVDVTCAPARLLRPGAVTLAALRVVVEIDDPGVVVTAPGARAPAPGTLARHYSPRALLVLLPAGAIGAEAARRRAAGIAVGTLEIGGASAPVDFRGGPEPRAVLPGDPIAYAAALYAALYRLDDAGCAEIVAAAVPTDQPAWAAVADRLRRAASR
jgi:L-threonylcarbamoyladenylate synthase